MALSKARTKPRGTALTHLLGPVRIPHGLRTRISCTDWHGQRRRAAMAFAGLEQHERRVYSQNGEDGVLEAIFTVIGVTNRFLVEFGCADAVECNGAYWLERGWQGLFMDGSGLSGNPR